MSVNTLQLVQTQSSEVVDSETTYGVVTIEVGNEQKETSNITTQSWYGENGEEAYIPASGVKYKAYDYAMTLGVMKYGGKSARTRRDEFINAISGKIWYTITHVQSGTVLHSAYLSKVEDDEYGEDFITFKVTFHITEP